MRVCTALDVTSWRLVAVGLTVAWAAVAGPGVRAETPGEWIDSRLDGYVELYKHFHLHPELSYYEKETSLRLTSELQAAGCDVTTEVGGHGVVGLLKNGPGPTVMWRCDLDALPIRENTGLDYASTVKATDESGAEVSVMHACGHDIHITNLIATALYMSTHREQWSGTLMFVGQPAEERGGGAKLMLEAGLFRVFPKPDFALATHVDATLPAGFVGYRGGYALASVDSCDITVKGRGGHGSFPQGCIDPIVQAAELVLSLQTIVSREISPLEPAVVTVGSIHGGTKHNIIPDTCHLQLTIRSYDPKIREQIKASIERKAKGVALAHKAPEPVIEFTEGTPAVFNDEALVTRITPAFSAALGADKVVASDRSMGGEDFSRYGLAGVPILMFRLGSVAPERMEEFARRGMIPPSLHSAEYFPEPRLTLKTGLAATVAALMELVGREP
jgi:hippurate hydrolase